MKINILMRYSKYFALLGLILTLNASVLAAETSNQSPVRLAGHVPTKAISNAVFLENLDANANIPLTFTLPLRNQEELEDLITKLYDPADKAHFGKYLSSEEFIEKYAPTEEDYLQVIAYAKEMGLAIRETHPNRILLNVSGQTKTIESAFQLNLHQYQQPNGRKFYAPNDEPAVPSSIASIIRGIVGLDNQAEWRPFHYRQDIAEKGKEEIALATGPLGGFSPNDIIKGYNLSSVQANGAGQNIALFQLASYQASDINQYTQTFGLPAAKLHDVLVDGGSATGINAEVTLDIELCLALAPQSQIYVYMGPNSGQGVLDTYNRIATDNIAKQVSSSWGLGEDLSDPQQLQTENNIFMQMAAQGQTIYAASGDSGAYDDYSINSSMALVVDDPAAQPYVTGVGGTKLLIDSSTGNYQSESVWNGGLGASGGGGISNIWPIPAWQKNVLTASSHTNRNVPDVCLNADGNTGYSIFHNGQWGIYGGTSCAAPLWAAFTARVNQQLAAAQKPTLGFANPTYYAIGTGAAFTTNFHDVTTGDNLHYPAQAGYDNATGWGSFNGANLFATLTNSTPQPPPPKNSPVLNISMSHTDPFLRGRRGTYIIQVTNNGNAPTSGPVNVAVNLPTGLSLAYLFAYGWFYNNNLTFTQNTSLRPGESYSLILLTTNVSFNAPFSVTPTATVSGGGSPTSTVGNLTNIR